MVAMGNERISMTLLCLGKCIIQLIRQHQVIFGGFNNKSTFIICRIAQANRRYMTQAARLFQVYEVQNFSNVWKTVNKKRCLKKTEVFHSSTQCVYSIGPCTLDHGDPHWISGCNISTGGRTIAPLAGEERERISFTQVSG